MNRYSVIYLLRKKYHQYYCETQAEAETLLRDLATQEGYKPIGVYDAKTELFEWEPTRQHQYDNATIERQGKLGDHMIHIAQTLRMHDEHPQAHTSSVTQLLQVDHTY